MSMVVAAEQASKDHAWFSGEVSSLLPVLYGAAVRLCHDGTDAEDLVAEALTKAWQKLPSLVDRGAFRGWLLTILTNTYLSQYRAASVRPDVEPVGAGGEDFSIFDRLHQPILLWWGNPEQEFLDKLVRDDIEAALAAVPEPFRTAVVLVDVRDLSYREVAEVLGVPVGTVRSRLARGRAHLQRHLWQYAQGRPAERRGEESE